MEKNDSRVTFSIGDTAKMTGAYTKTNKELGRKKIHSRS